LQAPAVVHIYGSPLNQLSPLVAVATLTVFAALSQAGAQATASSRGDIHGLVVNGASQLPISNAEVDVMIGSDSLRASHEVTSADGRFKADGLPPGRYRVRIRALGYSPKVLPSVVIPPSSLTTDVGTVVLTALALELQHVVVRDQKQDVELAPDRNTYVVRDMPTTRGGSAIDVLRTVPSVDVDIDNIVSLRGNSGVVLQINGRPSPLKPAQLGNYLAQLPADIVDKVEVVPNPSAKDDPEGVAGIINIVLKKETDAGTSGGLTVSGGTTGRADLGGNVGYQHGPLALYGSYGFMRDSRPRSDSIYRVNLFTAPLTYLDERGIRTQIPLAHTVTGSAEYALGEKDQLSADLNYSTRSEAETNTILYRDLNAARALTGLSERVIKGTNHEFNFESTLGYKHGFAEKGHKLSAEAGMVRAREGGPTSLEARDFALSGSVADISAIESATGYEHPDENSLKLDYSRPLSAALKFDAGYKGSLQTFQVTQDTRVFDQAKNQFVPDTTRISDFTYDQNVNAVYAILNGQAGSFVMQGGVRAERATTQFHLNTKSATYDNNYNSLFPSALVAYNIDESRQMKLSYSTRIRRPDDTDQIDPTLHYQDPLNIQRGNPNLKPEYTRALEFGYQQTRDKMTMQLTPFYRHTIDAIRRLPTIDSAGVATRTFANIATSDAYGADATVALNGGPVTGFVGASAFRQVSDAANLDPSLSARTFGWTARTNASLRVSPTFDVQTLLFYRAPMTVEQGRSGSNLRFSMAARRKLMSDQLSLTLRLTDPFNMSTERFTTTDPRFYQVSDRHRSIRGLLLSVNWMFGKPTRDHKGDQIDSGDNGPP
jgi:hypothetical protein